MTWYGLALYRSSTANTRCVYPTNTALQPVQLLGKALALSASCSPMFWTNSSSYGYSSFQCRQGLIQYTVEHPTDVPVLLQTYASVDLHVHVHQDMIVRHA